MIPRWLTLGCVVLLCSCATAPAARSRVVYRLVWTATRASDHSSLVSVSTKVAPGQAARVRTDSTRATEEKPAFPQFAARLSRTKNPGVYELVTRASLQEASRNRKGKLRFNKRNIGALVPIRPGQPPQLISSASDPIRLEVHLERQ